MKRNVLILVLGAILLLVSCSEQHKIARRFVKNNNKTQVALYMPERVFKRNLRNDSIPENLVDSSLQKQISYLEKQVKVIDKVNDDNLLDVIYLSMKETLKDYGLTVQYWEDETSHPDSTHWVIEVPRIEVTEVCEPQQFCGWIDYNKYCMDVPIDLVNVAAWFNLANDTTFNMTFTEQNYFNDTDVDFDYQGNKVVARIACDTINIDGFYRFAKILGKLYAGYCYDFMMNKYIDNHQVESIDTINRYRYDPYERYFYRTDRDYLIEIK
ncbi:MAG: hypothetical protein IK004_07450 [Bacteroidales bacterium]|nr:hypothetical protein [Bacteroidales bacterium]